jgi:Trk K+ transport system NAD-binding subunit
MESTFILCGLGRVGWRVLEHLRASGLPVVVVDNRCVKDDQRLCGTRLVVGDFRRQEVLVEAGIAQSRGILILTSDDLVNISTALLVRQLNPGLRVVLRLFNENLIPRLGKAVQNVFALSTSRLAAPLFASSALTGQALGTIRLDGAEGSLRQLAEVPVSAGSPYCGRIAATLAEKCQGVLLAHLPAEGNARLLLHVDPEVPLKPGDRVIVCGEPHRLAQLLEDHDDPLSHVRWAGWLRRMGRVIWRTVAEVDVAVKICAGVLFGVILLSTLVLYLRLPNSPLDRAFYRTISLMATAADMRADDPNAPWLRIFASVLRIVGAALMGAFTAILTNYLLRARLAGVLEVRRIPDSGHLIVCGLGNTGFRVVEELVKAGERAVVIEKSRDSRFVSTARRLGVPVLIGDATVGHILDQAHAGQARAVIAATNDDLVNLEVALMVRELNPTQRVVLQLSDPALAQTLRESANIRLALSVANLAAPAFVAALFGDRVQSLFMIDGRMLAAVDLVVSAQNDGLAGHSVRAAAIDYGFVPVAVMDVPGIVQAQPLCQRLEPGWRLIAISALSDLQRLLRREPVKANHAVDVLAFPLPARSWVASLLRIQNGLELTAADNALDSLPVCLGCNLTRGQAEDLLALLQRQRVTGKIREYNQQPRAEST